MLFLILGVLGSAFLLFLYLEYRDTKKRKGRIEVAKNTLRETEDSIEEVGIYREAAEKQKDLQKNVAELKELQQSLNPQKD